MARVLLVEDYDNLRKVYSMVLEASGHQVFSAANGREALATAAAENPEVILLDLLMPEMDGLRFLREFNLKLHRSTKVIVVSNMASAELTKEAKSLGVSQYLIKANVTPQEIAKVVQKEAGS